MAVFAPYFVRGLGVAPDLRPVDNVVVYERRKVRELHYRGAAYQRFPLFGRGVGCGEHEYRAYEFAARGYRFPCCAAHLFFESPRLRRQKVPELAEKRAHLFGNFLERVWAVLIVVHRFQIVPRMVFRN